MGDYCTVADLAAFLQISIAPDDAAALRAIKAATAAIRSYLDRDLAAVMDSSVALDGSGREQLVLPAYPVTAVSRVAVDGVELAPTEYKLSRPSGILHRVGSYWPRGLQNVEVVYSHGYDEIPGDVVDVCVRAAARAYQAGLRAAAVGGVAGIAAEQLADHNVQYASEREGNEWMLGASAAPILLRSEKEALDPYRPVVV